MHLPGRHPEMEKPTSGLTYSAVREGAEFIARLDSNSVPPLILERARACLFYALGTGVLCMGESYGKISEAGIVALDGVAGPGPGATAFGSGRRLSPSAAAFCNAVMIHGRCQEDTYESAHLGIAVIPPIMALVEAGMASPDRIIPSIVAGYEVGGALARAFSKATSSYGLRASPIYGTIAAAAASAKAMGLSASQSVSALAHAAAFTGGTLQAIADGTDEWRYQMGVAVRRGMEAAALGRAGAFGSAAALEGRQGFARVYARQPMDRPLDWGVRWALPDVAFKPYPICARNQTPAVLAARIREAIAVQDIASLRLKMSDHILIGMLEREPGRSIASTLMSTYFCVATILLHGHITLEMLADFENQDVKAMIERIQIDLDTSIMYPSVHAEVETISGEVLSFREEITMADYAYTSHALLNLLKRIALESGMESTLMDELYGYAYSANLASVDPVLETFRRARRGHS